MPYCYLFIYLFICELYIHSECSEGFPLPLGAWDGLPYFIETLTGPSMLLFYLQLCSFC